MLNLTIERFATYHDAVNGQLLIDGYHVCDTLEHKDFCLPEGRYQLRGNELLKDNFQQQKDNQNQELKDNLQQAPKEKDHHKPRLKACNGPYGLKDGSISVGECHHIGFIVKCEDHFLALSDRIRKTEKRGGEVFIEIKTNLLIQR